MKYTFNSYSVDEAEGLGVANQLDVKKLISENLDQSYTKDTIQYICKENSYNIQTINCLDTSIKCEELHNIYFDSPPHHYSSPIYFDRRQTSNKQFKFIMQMYDHYTSIELILDYPSKTLRLSNIYPGNYPWTFHQVKGDKLEDLVPGVDIRNIPDYNYSPKMEIIETFTDLNEYLPVFSCCNRTTCTKKAFGSFTCTPLLSKPQQPDLNSTS